MNKVFLVVVFWLLVGVDYFVKFIYVDFGG